MPMRPKAIVTIVGGGITRKWTHELLRRARTDVVFQWDRGLSAPGAGGLLSGHGRIGVESARVDHGGAPGGGKDWRSVSRELTSGAGGPFLRKLRWTQCW